MPNSRNIIPDIATLVDAARSIVFTARQRDELQDLTVKTVRKQVEHDFDLPPGALDPDKIKLAIRNAVNDAVVDDLPVDADLGQDQRKGALKKGSGASKLKRELAQEVEEETPSPNKEEAAAKKKVTIKKEALQNRAETQKQESKSKMGVTSKARSSTAPGAAEKDGIPKVKRKSSGLDDKPVKKSKQFKSRDIIDSNEDNDIDGKPEARKSGRGSAVTEKEVEVKLKRKKGSSNEEKSESEMSVLIDDGPRKKKQKSQNANVKTITISKKKGTTSRKEPEEEEETIRQLKTFVSACGARKQWAREFADLPEPKQQIEYLRSLLADLGMKGSYSIDKAKAIKQQRALSRELADVQEFERKAGISRAQRRRQDPKKRTIGELDTESEESEEFSDTGDEEESDADAGKKTKHTASRKIKEYLAKQNDSD